MIGNGQIFKGITVVLDGSTFTNCEFTHCELVFCGTLPVHLSGSTFGEGCVWRFAGPAQNTTEFMAALYQGGAHELVEKTFEAIKGGGTPPGQKGHLHS